MKSVQPMTILDKTLREILDGKTPNDIAYVIDSLVQRREEDGKSNKASVFWSALFLEIKESMR